MYYKVLLDELSYQARDCAYTHRLNNVIQSPVRILSHSIACTRFRAISIKLFEFLYHHSSPGKGGGTLENISAIVALRLLHLRPYEEDKSYFKVHNLAPELIYLYNSASAFCPILYKA